MADTKTTALAQALQDSIAVFAQQVAQAFAVNEALEITWRNGESVFPLARFVATADFYAPDIALLDDTILDAAQNETVLQRLIAWRDEALAKDCAGLYSLPKAELTETANAVAAYVHAQGGIVTRNAVAEQIAALTKEDRQALNALGMRLGAFTVYQRDSLKPAAMRWRKILWRVLHGAPDFSLPQEGNVSMVAPVDATAQQKEFYHFIGLPIYGGMCVRVDMIERLNSAIFDGAVEGKYTFNPALASTLGASVDVTHAILQDLGFPFEDVTTPATDDVPEKTVRIYRLKRVRAAANAPAKKEKAEPKVYKIPPARVSQSPKKEPKQQPQKQPRQEKEAAPQKPTGYQAFGALADLAALQSKK